MAIKRMAMDLHLSYSISMIEPDQRDESDHGSSQILADWATLMRSDKETVRSRVDD